MPCYHDFVRSVWRSINKPGKVLDDGSEFDKALIKGLIRIQPRLYTKLNSAMVIDETPTPQLLRFIECNWSAR